MFSSLLWQITCQAPYESIPLAALTPCNAHSAELLFILTAIKMPCCGRDTSVLCDSLTYDQGPPEILHGEPAGQYTHVYRPPFEEFEVARVELPAAASSIISANQVSSQRQQKGSWDTFLRTYARPYRHARRAWGMDVIQMHVRQLSGRLAAAGKSYLQACSYINVHLHKCTEVVCAFICSA